MIVAPSPASANCSEKNEPRQARISAGGLQLGVAAGMIGMEAGVDDELDRLRAELANRFDDLFGQLARSRIDDERALWSDLHGDIGAVAGEHVNVAGDMQHMNLSVVRRRVRRAARRLPAPKASFASSRRLPPRCIADFVREFRIHRLGTADCGQQRDFSTIGIFANVGVLAEEVIGDNVVLAAQNLLAVVARIQPGVRILRLSDEHGRFAQRFAQIDRIVDDGQHA